MQWVVNQAMAVLVPHIRKVVIHGTGTCNIHAPDLFAVSTVLQSRTIYCDFLCPDFSRSLYASMSTALKNITTISFQIITNFIFPRNSTLYNERVFKIVSLNNLRI
jgi:hypothetical protein